MTRDESILRFEKVSFGYGENHPLLIEVDFSVRRGTKATIMGQNGAGKSTIFSLITGKTKPDEGMINVIHGVTIALARQVRPRDELDLTVREFFQKCFKQKVYDIDPKIDDILYDTIWKYKLALGVIGKFNKFDKHKIHKTQFPQFLSPPHTR